MPGLWPVMWCGVGEGCAVLSCAGTVECGTEYFNVDQSEVFILFSSSQSPAFVVFKPTIRRVGSRQSLAAPRHSPSNTMTP